MGLTNIDCGFLEIDSTLDRTLVWYYRKNINTMNGYKAFLCSIKEELVDRLRDCLRVRLVKFNLKLDATYHISNSEILPEN